MEIDWSKILSSIEKADYLSTWDLAVFLFLIYLQKSYDFFNVIMGCLEF